MSSLFKIEADLQELLSLREDLIAELNETVTPELIADLKTSLVQVDIALDDYFKNEAQKVDSIAEARMSLKSAAAECRAEGYRLLERARVLEATQERFDQATIQALDFHGVKVVETARHKIRVQNNGGALPVVVDSLDKLPPAYLRITVAMPGQVWTLFAETFPTLMSDVSIKLVESNNMALGGALQRGEKIEGAKLGERGRHLRVS